MLRSIGIFWRSIKSVVARGLRRLNVLKGIFRVKLEIVYDGGVVYRAEGVEVFELIHDVVGRVSLTSEPEVDVFEVCPHASGFEGALD